MKRPLLTLVLILCAADLVYADETTRSLQQTLKNQGFYYGTVTGEKSAETTAAIRRYQIRNGLQVTGEMNEETLRSLSSSSKSVAAVSKPASKPAVAERNDIRPDATTALGQTSPPRSFTEPDRSLETDASYYTGGYQPEPFRVNRRTVAGVQRQLMGLGYYRGRIDGSYGTLTTLAMRAFQMSAGLPPTGQLDTHTLSALGLSDTEFAYTPPASRWYETWIPVTKFKHGKWKLKWKKVPWDSGNEAEDERRDANSEYGWQYHDD
jgi:peptidoglycan hydrolase-like protein with peptidoglycan-binding domain